MYQVLGRYFPSIGWVGAGEVALMSMIAMTFITTGYLVGRNGHIVLEIFDDLLAGNAALRRAAGHLRGHHGRHEPRPRL